MSYEDLFTFDGDKDIFEDCEVSQPGPLFTTTEKEEGFTDVFVGLDIDSRSELSSLSESDSKYSDPPERPVRKQLVIGKHIKITEGESQKFTCLICNCSFSRKQQVRYHDYCATGKRPLKCNLCGKGFVKKAHLIYHERTHTGESPFKCSICEKGFKQKAKLNRHEKTHETESRLFCAYCKKSYSDKDSLRKHEQKHSKKVYNCLTCKKSYSDKFTLKQHMAVHKSPNYICDVCGKSFLRKNSLNVHKQIHEDIYPFECVNCHRTFRNRKELNHHSVVHEKNNAGHECDICSITCGRKDNLLRHIRNCHLDPCQKKSQKEAKDNSNIVEENSTKVPPENPILKNNSFGPLNPDENNTEGRNDKINEAINANADGAYKPKIINKKGVVPSTSKLIVKLFSPASNSKAFEKGNHDTMDSASASDDSVISKASKIGKNEASLKNWKRLKTSYDEIVLEDNDSQSALNNKILKFPSDESFKTSRPEYSDPNFVLEGNSRVNGDILPQSQKLQLYTSNISNSPSGKLTEESIRNHELPNANNLCGVVQHSSVIMHTDLFKKTVIAANSLREPVIKNLRVPFAPLDNSEEPIG